MNSRSFPAAWQKEALFLMLISIPGKGCGYLLCRRAQGSISELLCALRTGKKNLP